MRAVIDTNILVAALRSRRGASYELLRMLRAKQWTLILSNPVVSEYEEILKRESMAIQLTLAEIDKLLDALCSLAERWKLVHPWPRLLVDPDDEALAHLAWEAKADCLVTFNLRHLAPLRTLNIPVLTPGEFLSRVRAVS